MKTSLEIISSLKVLAKSLSCIAYTNKACFKSYLPDLVKALKAEQRDWKRLNTILKMMQYDNNGLRDKALNITSKYVREVV